MRIGVGAVRKPEEAAYQRFATYEIVDPGTWTVSKGADAGRRSRTGSATPAATPTSTGRRSA